jgi:hypothetical protein
MTTNDPNEWLLKVTLMECMAEAHDEPFQEGERAGFDNKFLWRLLVNVSKHAWEKKASKEWESLSATWSWLRGN